MSFIKFPNTVSQKYISSVVCKTIYCYSVYNVLLPCGLKMISDAEPLLNGLCRKGGWPWERKGNGEETGTAAPFRDKLPRLSRKGVLRAESSINAPLRDNRGEGDCLERVIIKLTPN